MQIAAVSRWYIHATGSTCYNMEGVTFPPERAEGVNWEGLIQDVVRGPHCAWERRLGWLNQPHVLTFNATAQQAKEVEAKLPPHGFLVLTYWRSSRLVVEIEGGLCTGIYTNDQTLRAVRVDWDIPETDGGPSCEYVTDPLVRMSPRTRAEVGRVLAGS